MNVRPWRAVAPWIALAQIAGGPVAGASPNDSRSFRYLMGTSIRVEVYGGSAAERQAATDEAFAAMREVDRLMSNYRDDSELARVNRRAAVEDVHVTAPLMAVLSARRSACGSSWAP